jgi:hypothetical protein
LGLLPHSSHAKGWNALVAAPHEVCDEVRLAPQVLLCIRLPLGVLQVVNCVQIAVSLSVGKLPR